MEKGFELHSRIRFLRRIRQNQNTIINNSYTEVIVRESLLRSARACAGIQIIWDRAKSFQTRAPPRLSIHKSVSDTSGCPLWYHACAVVLPRILCVKLGKCFTNSRQSIDRNSVRNRSTTRGHWFPDNSEKIVKLCRRHDGPLQATGKGAHLRRVKLNNDHYMYYDVSAYLSFYGLYVLFGMKTRRISYTRDEPYI